MLTKEEPRPAVEPLSVRYKGAPALYLSLLGKLLRFDPTRRMTCAEALADPAFADIRDSASELRAAQTIKGDFDEEPLPTPPALAAAGAGKPKPPATGLGDAAAGLVAAATTAALGFGWGSAAVASSVNSLVGSRVDKSSGSSHGSSHGSFIGGGAGGFEPPALPGPTTERGLRRLIGLEVTAFEDEGGPTY
jgi:serine/threonine protein kinase